MAKLSPAPRMQFFTTDGNPLSGGLLYTYEIGTTTPLITYSDSDGTVANENPIVLDSVGKCDLWLTEDCSIILHNSSGVLQDSGDMNPFEVTNALEESIEVLEESLANDFLTGDEVIELVASIGSTEEPPQAGTYRDTASDNDLIGYLYCDGAAYSRTTYADLYTEIGDRHGAGDGTTTFNVPDWRGLSIKCQDDGAGVDLAAASRTDSGDLTTGDNNGTRQGNMTALPTTAFGTAGGNHNHSSTSGSSVAVTYGEGNLTSVSDYASGTTTSGTGAHSHTITGGDVQTCSENMYQRRWIKY